MASANDLSDAEVLSDLLEDVPGEIEQVSADGAYDQRRSYDTLNQHQARAAIILAKEPGFGATPTAKRSVTPATRICGGSDKSGAKSGSARATETQQIKVIELPRTEPRADWIPYPEAVSWRRMTDRVAQCMDRLSIESMPTAIIVTHECVASAIVKWRQRLPEPIRYGIEFEFRPCSVAEPTENDWGERIIVRLNDTAYL